ncbi:MAG: hypothetical protein AVDCRST_MAG49-3588 [uncultured Thermomicrobiales bacterium]|uniref:SnoaL-like domain-containing protein n=1 Tax=uncultured Thermomicrobiales bacterium TaxID=1645740 RepID=A0A6J4VAI6_9BACT|nr:MAG: hypothetical protein AVDCRST_MAG49-3588 [uncultured Thermomicrobiales bacterium]
MAAVGSAVDVVAAWHAAVNAADAERLAALLDPAVEVGGPRGTGHGAALVLAWVGRAGIRLEPGRVFHRGDTVVVEQRATWRSPDSGEDGPPQEVASVFAVGGGVVRRVVRHADLGEALAAAGLDEADAVRPSER